jgi:type I restriction enzyme S subunit
VSKVMEKKSGAHVRCFKPYPAYKDSGVEWLGKVPEKWNAQRLKYCIELVNDKVDGNTTDLPYTGLEHVESRTGKRIFNNGAPATSEGQANRFKSGDVLFGKLRPYLAKVLRATEEGICTGELLVIRPKAAIQDYLFNYLLSKDFITVVDGSTYGAQMPRASWEFIGNLPILLPSNDEQYAIAAFLGRETARIDQLIAKKERQIELLQEKRSALISHAVTKGLNPKARMKDSGIEWLGEIPEHWQAKRLKHISPRQSVGLVINPSTYVVEDGEVCFFFGADITEGHISTAKARRISQTANALISESILKSGDLVTIRVGYPGVTAVVPPELDGSNCASVMITRGSINFVSQWLCYAFNSDVGKSQVQLVRYGAAQKQFNIAHAVDFRFPVPPYDEQQAIASHLDRAVNGIYTLISKIESSINTLREFRTAIITAAVMGKIDVREEAA